jgi:PAS domain S-box-containing protein
MADSATPLQDQRACLSALALMVGSLPSVDFMREVTRTVAGCLTVERVSVWLTRQAHLECVDLFERTPGDHSAGARLEQSDYPNYFRALNQQTEIVAHDAHSHAATAEFSTSYLAPLGISSMLDTPIRAGEALFGVLCSEQVGEPRVWREDEINFACAAADLVSLAVAYEERTTAVRDLKEGQERLALALEASRTAVWDWFVSEGRLVWSDLMFEMFDHPREAFKGEYQDFIERVHPDDRQQVEETVQASLEGAPYDTEYRVVRRAGGVRTISARGRVYRDERGQATRMTGVCQDITERRLEQAERAALVDKINQAQKLESLGVLAGGIAHDFNNLLVGILGNASLALMDLPSASPVVSALREIELASERAAGLCTQLLAYSGKGRFELQGIDLSAFVRETQQLVELSVTKRIVVRRSLAENLPLIQGDPNQLRQILMNLLINAAEAIGEGDGVVSVTTDSMHCDREYLASTILDDDLPPGDYVYVEVSDEGVGMDEETLERIFDPFFTTKFTGRGLGLAAVQGIVRGHRGALRVYTEVGRGTSFKVLLPVASDQAISRPEPPAVDLQTPKGGARVLVVDDEPAVRALAARVLERAGYLVVTATNGVEALERYREPGLPIDCVLLDVTMPRLSGEETLRELRRLDQAVRVVLTSGFNEQDMIARFAGRKLGGFLKKPFKASELLKKIAEALI